jgi:hypothetical protein
VKRDLDVVRALLTYPHDPTPEAVEFELRRRGLWDLTAPALPVARLLTSLDLAESSGPPSDADLAALWVALSAAARALPTATLQYLCFSDVLSDRHLVRLIRAGGIWRADVGEW